MTAVVAYGVVTALGRGSKGLGIGALGEPAPYAIAHDRTLSEAGLQRPHCARAYVGAAPDPATALLQAALDDCMRDLENVVPEWRSLRIGLAIGTSSGGMQAFERTFDDAPGRPVAATYLGPVIAASRPVAFEPFSLVLGACASGTLAIGLARMWLDAGACDIALAGGFDAVATFVASGFEALRAICTERPLPFRVGRDGLALGEGAAVLAMVRPADARRVVRTSVVGYVSGFGATCDAAHLTAPDRSGAGLARAGRAALVEANLSHVDFVSAHGTGTDHNDVSEAAAIAAVAADASVVHALKGSIGHTLGAAGAVETLAAFEAMKRGVAPASFGIGEVIDPVRLLERTEARGLSTALKLSAAFGGANGALVLTRDEPKQDARPRRDVYVSHAVAVGADAATVESAPRLAARTGYPEDRIARGDGLVRLSLAATAALEDALGRGSLAGAGIVIGHGLATVDTNTAYWDRFRASKRGEPRKFPYTTPNAAAGECAIAFGLPGPAFAVGCGEHGGIEAIAVARDLVAGGVIDRVVVVAPDEGGDGSRRFAPETQPGAVALLVSAERLAARLDACSVRIEVGDHATGLAAAVEGRRALLPLVDGRPCEIEVRTPWGGFAKVRLFWL